MFILNIPFMLRQTLLTKVYNPEDDQQLMLISQQRLFPSQTVRQVEDNTKITKRKLLIFQNLMSEKVWLTSLCMRFTNCYL